MSPHGFDMVETRLDTTRSAGSSVDPARIERELADIWDSMAARSADPIGADTHERGAHTGTHEAVTRAAMSNVMIYCDMPEQAKEAADRIPLLVEQHPARVLVLVRDGGLESTEIKAWVTAHCRRLNDHTQLCAEHIELRFHPRSIERAASVVRSLLIGDLPVALWWMSPVPPALARGDFEPFARMAHQIMYDSVEWRDPKTAIQAMVKYLPGLDKVIFNLAWRRLKPWRRILAQSLDPAALPGALTGMNQIRLRHGPHALPMAWLLVGWLSTRLGWRVLQGKTLSNTCLFWRFARPDSRTVEVRVERQSEQDLRIIDMTVDWEGGTVGSPGGHRRFEHQGNWVRCRDESGVLPVSGVPVPRVRREQMVAAQLAHRAGDRLFEQTARVVGDMARALSA